MGTKKTQIHTPEYSEIIVVIFNYVGSEDPKL